MAFVLWIFEIGYLFQHLATLFQIVKILQKQKTEMISLETNILFLIGALCRIGWMWDSMLKSFFLAYIEIIFGISSITYLIFLYQINKSKSYYSNEITIPFYLQIYSLVPIIIFLAIITQYDSWFSSQLLVSISIYSEAIGLLPQLYMIHKAKDSSDISELYMVFLCIARLFRLLFWINMYLNGNKFLSLIIADVIHFICLFNFIYKAIVNFSGISLPTFTSKSHNKMF